MTREIAELETLHDTHVGDIVVLAGGELRIRGEVQGDVTVRPGGALVLTGRIKGAISNEGGAVDVFGFVGRVNDTGDTRTFLSRGAIVGGVRASRPQPLSATIA